ncbi:class I SAM-dependent methyltransferase [Rossellomorea marisflavi]|uniref:class I SAM-dependent methyltransferase n=1 Tax=Rossellomorea marisflavi TaxID=189381 RepID=UPI00296F7D16|nr:class I SAM-dependent methyltransferase [Rossellomorea marisflavi]MDW4525596.1 class I SAM-dependent methyltransferase [Rossellomorea marisflavi]
MTEYRGSTVYDNEAFFDQYTKRRGRRDSPNNAIEGPVMVELLGEYEDARILDLGSGDGAFGTALLEGGGGSYTGVDGSSQMVEAARESLAGHPKATVLHETLETYAFPEASFDLVTSRFVLHYIEDIESIFRSIHSTLTPGGRFIFSLQHPLTTSSFASKENGERRGSWIVDDYFRTGERKEPWIDQTVVKYHRTTEQYFTALTKAGFRVDTLREGHPQREHFSSDEEYERRLRIPVVLLFSCEK